MINTRLKVARLQVNGVKKRLGTTDFAFDLTVESPSLIAVTGPSGSGKSTFFNLIAGFETPDQGRILMDGIDVTGEFPGKRPLSFIFQDHNLFSHLDVFANVGLGLSPSLRLDARQTQEISQALEAVGLAGFERRLPAGLSGGERQRVAFARALVRKNPLILLDEPFAALDPHLRSGMGELLAQLQRQTGALVMMITHDPTETNRIADQIILIEKGAITSNQPTGRKIKA